MPVPPNLNYEMWLGCTPLAPYTEKRVHPQNSISDRPGWLRIESYCLGMITGWGAHHIDSAHWAMDTEYTGPIEISGTAEFPKRGLWDVHGPFKTQGTYANGVRMVVSGEFPNGIRFEGEDGKWIFVSSFVGVFAMYADRTQHRVRGTGRTVHVKAVRDQFIDDVLDLGVRGALLHHDDHVRCVSTFVFRTVRKSNGRSKLEAIGSRSKAETKPAQCLMMIGPSRRRRGAWRGVRRRGLRQ